MVISFCTAPCRLGASPERVCVAGEARWDQEDDGVGSWGHQTAGRRSGAGGHWKTDGKSWVHAAHVWKRSELVCWLLVFVHAAALRRWDPSAANSPGPIGIRPGQEDRVHLRASWRPASKYWRWLGYRTFHFGGERWWETKTVLVSLWNQTWFVWPGMSLTIESDIESTSERQTRRVKTFRRCALPLSANLFDTPCKTCFIFPLHLAFFFCKWFYMLSPVELLWELFLSSALSSWSYHGLLQSPASLPHLPITVETCSQPYLQTSTVKLIKSRAKKSQTEAFIQWLCHMTFFQRIDT